MGAVALATALGTCASAFPALADSDFPTLDNAVYPSLVLKPGARLAENVPTQLSSLFTLNQGSGYVGTYFGLFGSGSGDYSVSGGSYASFSDAYQGHLFGQNPGLYPSWTGMSVTANTPGPINLSGYFQAFAPCACNQPFDQYPPGTLFRFPSTWGGTIPVNN
jgi:hypothetical protein